MIPNSEPGSQPQASGETIPATYTQTGFLDLLADAAVQIRLGNACSDIYQRNRHARASIIASALSLESCANLLTYDVFGLKGFAEHIERLSPLAKFELAVRTKSGTQAFQKGVSEVERAAQILKIRDEFVHPKLQDIRCEIGGPIDEGDNFRLDLDLFPDFHGAVGIPKPRILWTTEDAVKILIYTFDFYRLLFVKFIQMQPAEVLALISPKINFGEKSITLVIPIEEFVSEINNFANKKADVSFMGI